MKKSSTHLAESQAIYCSDQGADLFFRRAERCGPHRFAKSPSLFRERIPTKLRLMKEEEQVMYSEQSEDAFRAASTAVSIRWNSRPGRRSHTVLGAARSPRRLPTPIRCSSPSVFDFEVMFGTALCSRCAALVGASRRRIEPLSRMPSYVENSRTPSSARFFARRPLGQKMSRWPRRGWPSAKKW